MLRVAPLAGRTFVPEDGKQGAAPVVILSEKLWRSCFGADPKIVGKPSASTKVVHRRRNHARRFSFARAPQKPGHLGATGRRSVFQQLDGAARGHWLSVIGRLKPGVPIAQAQAEMDAISARLAKEYPAENEGWTMRVSPLQSALVGDVKPALLILLGAVALVLLIACANIANLLLARATSRAKEMSVRIALGAGRGRIVRQLLTESAALGLFGGVAGILLAYWGVRVWVRCCPPMWPRFTRFA